MTLESNQGKFCVLSRRGVIQRLMIITYANKHRRKRSRDSRCVSRDKSRRRGKSIWLGEIIWSVLKNSTCARGHKGDDVFSYAQLLSFHRRATPARCSRIPSLFDCATTRLCAMENWNIQERCRFKRERDANNSDIPGPIGSRPGGHDGRLGNRPRKLKRQTRWWRSDRADNLSCHKEIGYIGLESLFRVLPVDIREFYLQPVALCLSLRPHPATPSRHLFLSRLCLRRAPLTGSTCKCIQYFKISSPLCHVRNRTTPSNCDSVQPAAKSLITMFTAHLAPSVLIRLSSRV